MKNVMLLPAIGAILVSPASGQSINIDYGQVSGSPEDVYGGAGALGVWNGLFGFNTFPKSLVDLRGRTTDVTITLNNSGTFSFDDANTTGNDQALLDDGILGGGDVLLNVTIEGLRNATYEVITYAWTPTMPDDQTFLLYEDLGHFFQITGGPWPGGLQPPVTHDVQQLVVLNGSISISFRGSEFGDLGFLNGMQFKRLSPADFNDDGIVDSLDLLDVIGNWGACDPSCPGNTNGDFVIDALDYLAVIAEWD